MHMAPRVAAWVAWAVWTCKPRPVGDIADLGSRFQVDVLERAGFGPLFSFVRCALLFGLESGQGYRRYGNSGQ